MLRQSTLLTFVRKRCSEAEIRQEVCLDPPPRKSSIEREHSLASLGISQEFPHQHKMAFITEITSEGVVPHPRSGSCVTVIDHCMYTWGGHTQQLVEDPDTEPYPVDETLPNTDDNFMDVYDIHNKTWYQYPTSGDVPADLGNGSALIAYGHHLYLFGGWNEGDFSSDLYRFDTHTNTWELVELTEDRVKPSPRYLTDAVVYNHQIYIYGGVGPPIDRSVIQQGAEYKGFQQHGHDYGFGWNNEMFLYDIQKKCWKMPQLAGDVRPPPCAGFTFNMIDTHRALMFGGRHENGRVSDVYVFDFHTNQWSGPFVRRYVEQPWPSGRTFHTVTCLVDPICVVKSEHHISQHLLVLWGKGDDNKHCQDVWILNVDSMEWKEVKVATLKPRMWHMSCAYHIDGTRTDVVLFGGNIRRKSNAEKHVQRGLTTFSFGVLALKQLCLECVHQNYSTLSRQLESAPVLLRTLLSNYTKHRYSYVQLN